MTELKVAKKVRSLWKCPLCYLVFVPEKFHLSFEEEKKLYDLHENHIENPQYLSMFQPIIDDIDKTLQRTIPILDYGCGPGPVLAKCLQKKGYIVETFDPIYFPKNLRSNYSAITCTEVVEHFRHPLQDWQTLLGHLHKDGKLWIRTEVYDETTDFHTWGYPREATHLAFYQVKTLQWLTESFSLKLVPIDKNIFKFET